MGTLAVGEGRVVIIGDMVSHFKDGTSGGTVISMSNGEVIEITEPMDHFIATLDAAEAGMPDDYDTAHLHQA